MKTGINSLACWLLLFSVNAGKRSQVGKGEQRLTKYYIVKRLFVQNILFSL